MKQLALFHRADSDGLLCREIARRGFESAKLEVTINGWDYNDPVPDDWALYDRIYMMDIAIKELLDREDVRRKTIWIDHHASSLKDYEPFRKEFYRWYVDTRTSACRLAWQYFFGRDDDDVDWSKRQSNEPTVVFLVGLRDIWQHKGTVHQDWCNRLELGLRANWPPDFGAMIEDEEVAVRVIDEGGAIEKYDASLCREVAERGAVIVQFDGLSFLCVNSLLRGSRQLEPYSQVVHERLPHDALMVWGVVNNGLVSVSLYHAPHNTGADLSLIAKAHNGGGHPGASGFLTSLDWIKSIHRTL